MLCLAPHLLPPARFLEAAVRDLRLPALETLLARGSLQPCPADGVEAAVCAALGIARQQDWPLAPIAVAADGGEAGDAYWLRADPVHLRVMRDRVVLASGDLELSREEADALAASIGGHFGEDFSPLPLHPQRWYLRFPLAPRLTTTPLSVAVGRDIAPLQPQGQDALLFRARMNELQMLLHAHPVNQARGKLAVNSLWLWGGGRQPTPPAFPLPLYGCGPEAEALATFCGMRAQALPEHPDTQLIAAAGIVLLDALARSGQGGDAYGWREALQRLEQDWFVPLRGMLRQIGPHGLRLVDPVNGRALHLHAGDGWRIWRRPRPLAVSLA